MCWILDNKHSQYNIISCSHSSLQTTDFNRFSKIYVNGL